MEQRLYYQPLRTERTIRLLTLESADDDSDPIKCTMRLVRLARSEANQDSRGRSGPISRSDSPAYEALSYVWGSPTGPSRPGRGREIVMDGWRMSVQENLWQFLIHARRQLSSSSSSSSSSSPEAMPKTGTRTLWIDALCINQTDNREKSSQVRMMGDVYRQADSVLVWLGPHSDDSDLVMSFLSPLQHDQIKSLEVEPDGSAASSRLESALSAWASRPYWSRVWTVQEFVHARKLRLMCGSTTVDWQALRQFHSIISQAAVLTHHEMSNSLHAFSTTNAYSLIRQRCSPGISKLPFLDVLKRNQHRQCFDPRDKIYAMLSLSADSDLSDIIVVDYERHPRSIVLDVLTRCHVSAADLVKEGEFLHSLLRIDEWEMVDPKRSFSDWRSNMSRFHRHRELDVTCFKTGEVVYAVPLPSDTTNAIDLLLSADRALIGLSEDEIGPLITLLTKERLKDLRFTGEMYRAMNEGLDKNEDARIDPPAHAFEQRMLLVVFESYCRRKQFLLGLGSGAIRRGDKTTSFLRSRNVLILREHSLEAKRGCIIGRAVCAHINARASTGKPEPEFRRLATAAECVAMSDNMTLRISDVVFSSMMGS